VDPREFAGGLCEQPGDRRAATHCVVLVIVFAMVPATADAPWRQRARAALYVFVASALVLALHFYAVSRRVQKEHSQDVASQIMSHIQGAQTISQPMEPVAHTYGAGSVYGRGEPALPVPAERHALTLDPIQFPSTLMGKG